MLHEKSGAVIWWIIGTTFIAKTGIDHVIARGCTEPASAQRDDAPSNGSDNGLCAGVGVELAQNRCHMVFNGLLTDVKHGCDLLVKVSLGHIVQYLHLAGCKR